LNFAGLLEYSAAPKLEAQVLHTRSQRAQRCWLGLVLLVSRQMIMAAASRMKLTRRSESPSKPPVPAPRRSGTDKGAAKQQ
jgi:hypothetical protein